MASHQPNQFSATRAGATEAAKAFAPHMGSEYGHERNRVVPGHPFVSRLAPALRVRLITEYEVARIALDQFGSLQNCEKFVQEVNWRGYWRSWLELRPEIWTRYQHTRDEARDGLAKVQRRRIEQVEAGQSGCEPMDNFARELVETGYIHNHARMWFASYWIHIEKLPWELGADFFERHLICACPASNTLSWRWVAGLHTRGKTYLARRSNLEKYCDPAYLGDEIGMEPLQKPTDAHIPLDDIPKAIIPQFATEISQQQGRTGLWITEDDLCPETSDALSALEFDAIATSVVAAPPQSDTSNGLRHAYRTQAARDAAERAHQKWNREATNFDVIGNEDLAQHLTDWAKSANIQTVVALKPFVGPTQDALDAVQDSLKSQNIELKLLRRPQDAELLSWATAGFFKFWQGAKKSLDED